jgi:PhzF family phenazine biosynthesis protein
MEILRYAAFTADPSGGNPAGVVLEAPVLSDSAMLKAAAEIGFSETAFVAPGKDGSFRARYFSPLIEVPFCGHATIALAVAHAERHGPGSMRLETNAGVVLVSTERAADGSLVATLVSVRPRSAELEDDDLTELLAGLCWATSDLDPALPPRVAYAGAWHPVIAASNRARLAELDYDMPTLAELMRRKDWATIDLIWRESPTVYHARNPFPPGGVVEDPATGAAAAAFGGYLRELGLIPVPATITIRQGQDMGRPGVITVSIPAEATSGLAVTGTAVAM